MANYRPISILPTMSKIIEKCLKKRLTNFIDNFKILNPNQYGFQKCISTQDAILNFTEYVYNNLNNNSSTL